MKMYLMTSVITGFIECIFYYAIDKVIFDSINFFYF